MARHLIVSFVGILHSPPGTCVTVPEKGGLRDVPSGETNVATVKMVYPTLVCVGLTGKSRELWLALLRYYVSARIPHLGMLQCVLSRKNHSISEPRSADFGRKMVENGRKFRVFRRFLQKKYAEINRLRFRKGRFGIDKPRNRQTIDTGENALQVLLLPRIARTAVTQSSGRRCPLETTAMIAGPWMV